MESLSFCIVAGVILFYQTVTILNFPVQSKYTEGVALKNAIMMWQFQVVCIYAISRVLAIQEQFT